MSGLPDPETEAYDEVMRSTWEDHESGGLREDHEHERRYVLGVDPGYTTGWSLVDIATGDEHGWRHIKFPDMAEHLAQLEPTGWHISDIVIEDFTLLGGKALAQTGSHFETVQVIGMFRLWAVYTGTPVHMQPPSIKTIAEKYTGVKPRGAHDKNHHVDAFNHACYWLRTQGKYVTKLEREGLSDHPRRAPSDSTGG
jgi:hypothetical protein